MSDSKRTYLVPTAFSEQSLLAVNQAATYCVNMGAKMVLLSVVDENTSVIGGIFQDKGKSSQVKEETKTRLEALAEKIRAEKNIEVEVVLASGTPYEKIVEIAEMLNANMIIMGTDSSYKGLRKRFIGTNAMRVVTSASCPVVTVKGDNHKEKVKNIVLPLDLQKETKQKVGRAIEIAKRRGATIHVISVIKSMDEFLVNALKRNFHQVERLIEGSGVDMKSELIQATSEDSISDLIIGYGEKVNAELIMIMTQQESNFTEYFMGSLAQQIILKSRIPVMSIQPKYGSSDLISSTGSY